MVALSDLARESEAIAAPGLWLSATEPLRAALEFASMFARLPALLAAPRGDGHTVMVLPGFATSDVMTQALRNYLSWLGYDSEPWRLGFNTGYLKFGEDQAGLHARLSELAGRSADKVSLVGWSLGGMMARQMARRYPEAVRRVITLGSPFTGDPRAISIRGMYKLVSGESVDSASWRERFERDRAPPAVPTTAIYSRNDGVTAWRNCIEEPAAHTENIEVGGSHLGLTHNPEVLLHVAAILARPRVAQEA
ncbi:alpha/beta fold hydrolase [Novosphingobium sp. Gsoil 351]|uniref:alpha/beta fold hydrolase n=1 Tax=Novosphingobium sp. Gsoil 351 TaxID=2675225 RepID=UPI0012B47B6D|nr:alpha/beta fold hydrolase [Novosphingobium sp. Gsoil 351]QGN54607.1 alpha/beta fold hydrolase [Novosphingobium sp. Gsoil 351]